MKLSIVIPCYNEEEVLPYTLARVTGCLAELLLNKVISNYEIILVNDASIDNTEQYIKQFIEQSQGLIKLINLNSNSGHQSAMLAGICNATGDAIISLDADLQDSPEYFEDFIKEYKKGNDVVIGVWNNREIESPVKRFFAVNFYRVAKLLGVPGEKNAGDFRLISKTVQKSIMEYPERNLYLRGLIPSMKFKTAVINYKRAPRVAGTTKYPFTKSLNLAIDGITSFSIRPLRIVGMVGIILFIVSILLIIYILRLKIMNDIPIVGWTSTITAILLFQSINFIFLAVIGEYLGKTYVETKQRPRYVVKDKINF